MQSAARQGNRLQMNVYETRGMGTRGPVLGSSKAGSATEPKKGFRPPQTCPALAQVVSRKVQAAMPEQSLVRLISTDDKICYRYLKSSWSTPRRLFYCVVKMMTDILFRVKNKNKIVLECSRHLWSSSLLEVDQPDFSSISWSSLI